MIEINKPTIEILKDIVNYIEPISNVRVFKVTAKIAPYITTPDICEVSLDDIRTLQANQFSISYIYEYYKLDADKERHNNHFEIDMAIIAELLRDPQSPANTFLHWDNTWREDRRVKPGYEILEKLLLTN